MPQQYPAYFGVVIEELLDYYEETGLARAQNFLARNIPQKLYRMGLLTDAMTPNQAKDIALTYASKRQALAKQGMKDSEVGDLAAQEMLKEKEMPEQTTEKNYDDQGSRAYFPRPEDMPDFPIVSFTEVEIPLDNGDVAILNWTVRGYSVLDVMDQWADLLNVGGKMRRVVAKPNDQEFSNPVPNKRANPNQQLDDYFGTDAPPKLQGDAQPKGNQPTQDSVTVDIVAIEFKPSKEKGTPGFLYYKKTSYQGVEKVVSIGQKAEYRSTVNEPILKALGFSVESISNMESGDKKNAKNEGVKCVYHLDPQANGQKWTVIDGYILPDGKRVGFKNENSNAKRATDEPDNWLFD